MNNNNARLILPIALAIAAALLLFGQGMKVWHSPDPASLPLCEESTAQVCYSDFGDEVIHRP